MGQLVENNCKISFSSSSCLVQDQKWGTVIGKGPKCGRLFPPYIQPSPKNKTLFSFLCTSSLNKDYLLWHRRLGHPNAQALFHLLNSGFVMHKTTNSMLD